MLQFARPRKFISDITRRDQEYTLPWFSKGQWFSTQKQYTNSGMASHAHSQKKKLFFRNCSYWILLDVLSPYQFVPQLQTSCRSTKLQQPLLLPWESEYFEMLLFLLSGSASVASPLPVIMCHLKRQNKANCKTWSFTHYTKDTNGSSFARCKKKTTHIRRRPWISQNVSPSLLWLDFNCEGENNFSSFVTDKMASSQHNFYSQDENINSVT